MTFNPSAWIAEMDAQDPSTIVRNAEELKEKIDQFYNEYRKMAAVIEHIHTGVAISDPKQPDNPLIFVNPAFTEITQYTIEDVLGRNCRFMQGPETSVDTIKELRNAIQRREPVVVEILNHKKDGSIFWNELRISPVYDDDDELLYFIGLTTDVTERKENEKKMHFHANHDPLTRLPNRKYLMDTWEERVKEAHDALAVLFIDLNGFKSINDNLGHHVGDEVLQAVAHRLKAEAAQLNGFVARISGDEFVIAREAEQLTNGELMRVGKQVLQALVAPVTTSKGEVTPEACIGISTIMDADDHRSFERLIQEADAAMYRGKEEGGNQVFYFDESHETHK
ncbi:PAS domain S-box-containing protein/diguanylate cyclase (GGDEF)-like protein [Salsuginibacillus halophilus]|uniref:PAS domain S-box-containing protein/diguanylate cyclase (GGDEF)-like protein n=1 Tax=Salsuginibacillus halophilus TaxID=517424 RepID=A0A2P8HI75_9BACI|nr:GGDEF domain-containing protein [Salsuginibacillus halophilus]PSL45907.1 PAS domain S-box-containing protein/diguanylate cyclase (GGDEF)-like protein [Salsuginibacillus halophilus]